MVKIFKRSSKTGLPPGTPVFVGEEAEGPVRITIIDYDEENFQEIEAETVEDCYPFKEDPSVTWINVDGIHQVDVIEKLGQCFNLHPLIQEDILNTEQRPKMEDHGDYLFIILRMVTFNEELRDIDVEQVSLILGAHYVISFQEKEGDIFEPIRDRIRNAKGRIRKMGADYLAYSLMDTVVDNYFIDLERLGEIIEEMEEILIGNPKPETLRDIHKLKREMIYLRKSVWPLREVISSLERGEFALIRKSTRIYLKDIYDHTIQVIDTVETFRDMLSGMHDTYLSSISNRMNEVMKVLTIIATIFIPLTFIAGIYGMNFEFMPELKWKSGYFIVLGIMIVIVGFMLFYFRRKKWL